MRNLTTTLAVTFTAISLLAAGCGDEPGADAQGEAIDAEITQAALQASSDAIGASLVTIESARLVAEVDSQGGASCPEVSREGGVTEFEVSADYGEGCTPDSGIVSSEVSGDVTVGYSDRALSVSFGDLAANGNRLDGEVVGAYEGASGGSVSLTLEVDLTAVIAPETLHLQEVITSGLGTTELSLDGSATLDYASGSTYALEMSGLAMTYADLAGACPLPYAGAVAVDIDGTEATVTFSARSPQTGEVEVTVGRITTTTNLCEAVTPAF